MWPLAVATLAIGLGYLFIRRSRSDVASARLPVVAEARDLVCLVAPQSQSCCAAMLDLQTHRFKRDEAPTIPLPSCSMADTCRCRYQLVPERRIAARRSGGDRRERLRYDSTNRPRRWGPGRRKTDWLFHPISQFFSRDEVAANSEEKRQPPREIRRGADV
jgi:hypothetical protein